VIGRSFPFSSNTNGRDAWSVRLAPERFERADQLIREIVRQDSETSRLAAPGG